jgi:hypothetical protein
MKALVYCGPGIKEWKEVANPEILKPTDAIVRVETTTICGTDLHILKGDVPAVTAGRILGHEGVGTITELGSSVTNFKVGDRVIISCIKSCGACANCKQGLYSHCLGEEGLAGLGWVLGHLIDGTQAEFVRIPYADNSLHKMPACMCVLGMAEEFKRDGIGVNALWPRTVIDTAALQMIPGIDALAGRTPEILADAAYIIFNRDAKECTGNFFVDDLLLASEGITDLEKYSVTPGTKDFLLDFFLD